MSTSLTIRGGTLPDPHEWKTLLEMADVFIKSGLLPEAVKTPAAAVLIMAKGRELGIQPLQALSSIAVIKGKPAASAELMLALIYRDHGDDAIRFGETSGTLCTLTYKRRSWTSRQTYSFSIQDAATAGLTGNMTWKQYPAAMLRARCISAVARMAFPDTIGGLYTPEELGGSVSLSDVDEPTIHVPQQVIEVNRETGEVEAPTPPAKALDVPAEPPPRNEPSAPPSRKVPSLEARYRELLDRADVLNIPGESFDPRWPVEELTARGKALHQKVQERELAAMGTSR